MLDRHKANTVNVLQVLFFRYVVHGFVSYITYSLINNPLWVPEIVIKSVF